MLTIWQRLEPTIQNRDARELPVCLAYEADDTETPRGMRGGDILRPSRSLEKAQYIRLWLREQTSRMQRKIIGTSVSADAPQKRSRQSKI